MQEPLTLNGLIKRLYPLPARLKVIGNDQERHRARALTVLLLTSAATVWFWTAVLSLSYFFLHLDILWNVVFGLFVSTVLALQIWAFFRFANVRVTSMLYIFTYFLMALSLVLMSGGFHSSSLVILLSSPVVSFRAGGKDEGIMNSFFVGLTGLALMVTDYLDVPITNYLSGMNEGFLFGAAWVVTITIIASCLVTYDMDE